MFENWKAPDIVVGVTVLLVFSTIVVGLVCLSVSSIVETIWTRGFNKGHEKGYSCFRDSVINRGLAEYQVNPQNGQVEFRWKEIKDAQEK